MRSIERYLLKWIVGALVLGSLMVVGVAYRVTSDEMNEVFDADLKNIAEAVASYHLLAHVATVEAAPAAPRTGAPGEYEIATQTWTPDGKRVYASHPSVTLGFNQREGLTHAHVGGEDWVVYTTVRDGVVAQAAQRVAARRVMAGESAAEVLPPLLLLTAVAGALLVYGLRRGLRPLDSAARDVAARSAHSLEPIPVGDVPREIEPLVSSINGLMTRLASAFSAQRRFLADAAHELRTPVTALRLQLQLLRRSTDEASRSTALAELAAGIDRSQHLIEQLLQVARAEPEGEERRESAVDLGELVRSVVGGLSLKAEQRGIDLGATGAKGIVVRADADQLTVLLTNLVDNALHYTPQGGVVDVEAADEGGRVLLRVVDNGPGIEEAERERVFDRFYRGSAALSPRSGAGGSGLGLAIVRAIAERHGAAVSLLTPAAGAGLEVRIEFWLRNDD